jgi:hypothetical protein
MKLKKLTKIYQTKKINITFLNNKFIILAHFNKINLSQIFGLFKKNNVFVHCFKNKIFKNLAKLHGFTFSMPYLKGNIIAFYANTIRNDFKSIIRSILSYKNLKILTVCVNNIIFDQNRLNLFVKLDNYCEGLVLYKMIKFTQIRFFKLLIVIKCKKTKKYPSKTFFFAISGSCLKIVLTFICFATCSEIYTIII